MADNDEMNLQQQQQQQETAFKTEQDILGNMTQQADQSFMESMRKQSMSEKDNLEKRLEKADSGVAIEEIKRTEKAAATDPDDDMTRYNMDFAKTEIAFSKLPTEPPQNPRAAIKAASKQLGK